MFILLVSSSTGKSIRRVNKVIDQYAIRIGKNTWHTPITTDGMNKLKQELKSISTRTTSVDCYINDGRYQLKQAWYVGNRQRKNDKHFATHYTKNTDAFRSNVLPNVRLMCLTSRLAGYAHDIGKASSLFQAKLKAKTKQLTADPFRHEWVSMKVYEHMRKGDSWDDAWKHATNTTTPDWVSGGVKNMNDVIDLCVGTHHGLIGSYKEQQLNDSHVRQIEYAKDSYVPVGTLNDVLFTNIKKCQARINKAAQPTNQILMEHMAIISRAMLIMADHVVSARNVESTNATLYANTKNKKLNQDLNYHLQNVGDVASDYVFNLYNNMTLPAMSADSIAAILTPAKHPAFEWQDKAAQALTKYADCSNLVFNVAETGAGKTIGNLKLAAAMRKSGLRLSVSLNLRALTMQTGSAIKSISSSLERETAVVIGDSAQLALYNEFIDTRDTEDEDVDENGLIVDEDFIDGIWDDEQNIEPWMKHFINNSKREKLIGAPVLISTIDYIIHAGDPDRKHHHVLSLLRVASSDLIIDELDNFDPGQMIAVCRVIQLAAAFGRNVICSSATLTSTMIKYVSEAFKRGCEIRQLIGVYSMDSKVGFVDNNVDTVVVDVNNQVHEHYEAFVAKKLYNHANICTKLATMIHVPTLDENVWMDTIANSIAEFHGNHHETVGGVSISRGLIRVGNINTAINLSIVLSKIKIDGVNIRIACYHSQDTVVGRFKKEVLMDHYLTRKHDSPAVHSDLLVKENTAYIVIATPVEEVGRDHDFDWAIIEPSSTQSIIQTSGRVNRHRKLNVTVPNIGIMQYNKRSTKNNNDKVFVRPGLEKYNTHPDHDMANLLPWNPENKTLTINAGILFDDCKFAQYDDKAVTLVLMNGFKTFFKMDRSTSFDKYEFANYRLRAGGATGAVTYIWKDSVYEMEKLRSKKPVYMDKTKTVQVTNRRLNDWMVLDYNELKDVCDTAKIDYVTGIRVSVNTYNNSKVEVIHDKSFGWILSSALK